MLNKNQFQNRVAIFFWFYTAIIILLFILPINGSESCINNIFIVSIRLDYLAHLFLFIPWMFLWKNYTRLRFDKSVGKTILFITLGIQFAFCSELIQYYLPYRAFNINDLMANMAGIGIGAIFFLR